MIGGARHSRSIGSTRRERVKRALWRDRELVFRCNSTELALRDGERRIDFLDSVEDSKDKKRTRGRLVITNLRIMWQSHTSRISNISIGYGCVLGVKIKKATSKLRGTTQALFISVKKGEEDFEFIFTSLVKSNPRIFVSLTQIVRSYETSRLYRDVKLRGGIIREKNLVLLPNEQVYSRIEGVSNIANDKSNLGTLIVTNVRVVWFLLLSGNFNASIPYVQISNFALRDSKYGVAVILKTTQESGGLVLAFRVDPQERLPSVYKEIKSLWNVFKKTPIFGVRYTIENDEAEDERKDSGGGNNGTKDDGDDDEFENHADDIDSFAAYYSDGSLHDGEIREIVVDGDLGLAIEGVPKSLTIPKLWSVVGSSSR